MFNKKKGRASSKKIEKTFEHANKKNEVRRNKNQYGNSIVNCKICNNPFGSLNKKIIEIDYKRVSNIQHDFETKKTSVKCRKCSHYSTLSFEDDFVNDLDLKKTGGSLLG